MKNYLEIFRNTGALLDGHFVLTSGRHSASYFQCAKVLQYPEHLLDFSKKIMDHFTITSINTVISPAVGGIVIGTEVGRVMNKKTIFAERENGQMAFIVPLEVNSYDKNEIPESLEKIPIQKPGSRSLK